MNELINDIIFLFEDLKSTSIFEQKILIEDIRK